MNKIRVQLLYILDCPWCVKTKKLVRESLKELRVKAEIEEILIDTEKKAKKYKFIGSPTVRINRKDIQEKVSKGQCLPCEELAGYAQETTGFIKQECRCGCRIFFIKENNILIRQKE